MFFLAAAAAASNVLDYVSSLQQLSQAGTGNGQASNPFSLGNNTQGSNVAPTSSGTMGMAPSTMNTLLSAQSQTTTKPALTPDQTQVFAALDTNGNGQLNKSEFEKLFGPGNTSVADAIFSKVDTNGDGEISQNELAAALKNGEAKEQSLASSSGVSTSQGDKTQTTTNTDGSTTTTITYADGSQVSMTTPSASSGSNAIANNLLEQLIQRQALAVASVGQSVSMNV